MPDYPAPIPTPDLTTLANVKDYMQISDTSQDTVLTRLISAFSQWFLTQVNRGALLLSTYTEQRNGSGGDSLTTIYWPIQAVTSLSVDGITIPPSPGPNQPGFVFDSFSIWLVGGYRFCRGRGNIQIVYQAGYTSTPLDVEQAVIDQVAFTLRRQPNLGTVSQSMNGITTVSFSQQDLAPGVKNVVQMYRDRAVVGL